MPDKIYSVMTREKKPLRVPMDRAKTRTLIKRRAPQSLIDRMIDGLVQGADKQRSASDSSG